MTIIQQAIAPHTPHTKLLAATQIITITTMLIQASSQPIKFITKHPMDNTNTQIIMKTITSSPRVITAMTMM